MKAEMKWYGYVIRRDEGVLVRHIMATQKVREQRAREKTKWTDCVQEGGDKTDR